MKYEKLYEELHKQEVQMIIRNDNRQKAGIYMIENKVNGKRYVGCASTNRINVRFRNHLIHGTGQKNTAAAVAKYGIENFNFYILEYFPGFVKKENLSKPHTALLELETKYIKQLKPEYNIQQVGTRGGQSPGALPRTGTGFKHPLEQGRERWTGGTGGPSEESGAGYAPGKEGVRREGEGEGGGLWTAGRPNSGPVPLVFDAKLLSEIAKLRNSNEELRARLSLLASKPVTLFNLDGSVHTKYPGIRKMAAVFNCCSKTINKAIADQSHFKGIGKIKLD